LEGIAFDREHDLESWTHYLEGVLAQIYLNLSQFDLAKSTAQEALMQSGLTAIMRLPAQTVLTYVALREGDDQARDRVDEALNLSISTREAQRILPTVAAAMESAWLTHRREDALAAYQHIIALESFDANLWDFGACEIWRHRLGIDVRANIAKLAPPYAAEVAGDTERAAALWREVGDTYAEGLCLANGPSAYWAQAIEIF
jgi:hypothetical protein